MKKKGLKKSEQVKKRVVEVGSFISETGYTLRQLEKYFNVSKSTIHKDINDRLLTLNKELYFEARTVLERNKAERHKRGGLATKLKSSKAID